MKQEPGAWQFSFSFSWQRLLASLLFAVGALVLGYGLIRPRVSEYVGQQVSEQINAELAREVVAALVGELDASPQPAAQPVAPLVVAAAAGGATQPTAPGTTAQPVAVVAGQPAPTAAVVGQPAPAAVDSGGLLRAIVAPPTAERVSVAQPEAQAPVEATPTPAATAAPGSAPAPAAPAAPAPSAPTQVVAPPITAPRTIEEIVGDLPSGEIIVTEEKLNGKITGRAASLGPIDRIVVRFVPGEVQVTLTVLGQDTIGTSQLTIKDGKVAAENPQISGALSLVISVADLVRPIEEELNSILDTAGRQVRAVRIEQGQIVVTMN